MSSASAAWVSGSTDSSKWSPQAIIVPVPPLAYVSRHRCVFGVSRVDPLLDVISAGGGMNDLLRFLLFRRAAWIVLLIASVAQLDWFA